MLFFAKLKRLNRKRCEAVFHSLNEWSPTDWGCAFAGEAGEACNKIKKLRRGDPIDIKKDIGYEIADTVIYADLLCSSLGLSLEEVIREKFNITSDKNGSNIKL